MNGGGDVTIDELQAIVAMSGRRLVRETEIVERSIKPIAGPVAGEDSSCPISTMSRRSEADDKKPRVNPAKAGDGASPVFPIPKPSNFVACDSFAVFD